MRSQDGIDREMDPARRVLDEAPAPLAPPPKPVSTAVDRYVPDWFPGDLNLSDLSERANFRFYNWCKWTDIKEEAARAAFLSKCIACSILRPDESSSEDVSSLQASSQKVVYQTTLDKVPRTITLRARSPPSKPGKLKPRKPNGNAKRTRTMRKRFDAMYKAALPVLKTLQDDLSATDFQFRRLLKRHCKEAEEESE